MKVDIIGAGIGGLTTAIALQQKGIDVQVYEQSHDLKPVGAGIILAINAMQVYDKLGLKKEIESQGIPVHSLNITQANLRPLSHVDLKSFEDKSGCQNIAIHRGKLQQILLNHINPGKLNLDCKLVEIKREKDLNHIKFENGKEIHSSITLGADGMNSVVRKYLFPKSKLRDAYQVCWRGIVDFGLPEKINNALHEAWGNGNRFGFVPVTPTRVYWYALESIKNTGKETPIEHLGSVFTGYNRLVGEIIGKTPVDIIHRAKISDLNPLEKWYQDNICLIGDAAHAMTPNMGQGACQAIEDAYVISECLARFRTEEAFPTFQKFRRNKVDKIVSRSWQIGKIAHWKSPFKVALRTMLLWLTPDNLSRKQSEKIFQFESI